MILSFQAKTPCIWCTWQKSALQAPERRQVGRPPPFGGSLSELLSTRNPSVPGFHPGPSHWGQRWEPLNTFYRSPFFRMKSKCFCFDFPFGSFLRFHVFSSVSLSVFSHPKRVDGVLRRASVAVSRRARCSVGSRPSSAPPPAPPGFIKHSEENLQVPRQS